MDRVVIVTKPTRLEELIEEHLTFGAAQFALESRGESIKPYQREDTAHKAAIALVRQQIPNDLPVTNVTRHDLPNFLFRDKDLIIVCGVDGLFANVAKYVKDQPVLTVNPDPSTVAGVLMLFRPEQVGQVISSVKAGDYEIEQLPFVKATIDDSQEVWGINDIFIGRKDHISARYELSFDGRREYQSSSGIIVSTGIGSTGWVKSVAAMVEGLSLSKQPHRLSMLPYPESNELVFVVREPFASPITGTSIVTGRIVPGKPLVVSSQMPEGGCIFSDGVVEKTVPWSAGSKVVVSVGDRYVNRIVQSRD